MLKKICGVPASGGLAIGKALLWTGDIRPDIPCYTIKSDDVPKEWERFQIANNSILCEKNEQLTFIKNETETVANKAQKDILQVHILMLSDADFHEQIKNALETQLENIEWIVHSISQKFVQTLLASPNAELRERIVDISDVTQRILNKLLSVTQISLSALNEDCIVVAHDIPPSAALTIDKKHIKAIAIDAGSATSHAAILARSFQIPTVVGLLSAAQTINSGDILIVDGNSGCIIINPNEKTLLKYQAEIDLYEKKSNSLYSLRKLPAITKDKKQFVLKANIEVPSEAEKIGSYGAQGIGLYRSEFLFLGAGSIPEEDTQYKAYSDVIKSALNLPVTIRTIDIGGDKVLPGFFQKEEKNPLLGWRAIRFSLSMPELFKAQLRAILRAGVHGNAQIMFPMISSVDELEQALAILEEAKKECREKKQSIDENIKVGTMIEVPSAVIIADILAKKCDFFSIGTNDLMQYTFAVDRGNEKVSYLACHLHPAMLRMIKNTIDAAHNAGIQVTICGEMAASTNVTPILVGLGLDAFSMSASLIPEVKSVIRNCRYEDCRVLAEKSLLCEHSSDVQKLLKRFSTQNHRN